MFRGSSTEGGLSPTKFSPSKKNKALAICAGILIVLLAATAGFFLWQYLQIKNNPDNIAQETSQRIVKKVGAIYAIPEEKPTVATIEDKEKLKDQEFFNKAQNGDFLLVFATAKLALIYREAENKLINAGPISLDQQPAVTP